MIRNNNRVGIICYLKPLTNEELQVVNRYWEINSSDPSKFAKKVDDIKALFPEIGIPSAFVSENSEFVITNDEFSCSKCGKMPKARNRTNYLAKLKKTNYVCDECQAIAIQLERQRKQEIINTYKNIIVSYKATLFEKDYDLSDLTYVEKISLFLILNSYYNNDKPLSITNENLDLSGSQDFDSKLFVDLAQKGCLVIVNDLPEEVQEAYDAIYGRYSRLHYDNGYNRSRYSETRDLAQGVYFNMPTQIEDISQVRTELYAHICASKISVSDIQQITQLVEDIRLANLYECINWLEKEEFRIPIEKTMKLDSLLKFVSKNYSLDKTYYSLWYHARETGAYIQKIGSRDFKTPRYFGKFLSDYFTKVKTKGWELKYTRSLPMDVNTSAIESLICELYFDDEFNWVSLTTTEIVSTWLKKLDITDTLLIENNKD
ncbi:MAG: hypothetical protein HWE10_13485 [Gammaproteobacteria bacterium]|nr:hypothetical protein [Gammaproteobacteria bacterium]